MAGKDADVLPQPRSEHVPPRPRPPVVLPAVPGALGTGTPAQYGLTYQNVAFRSPHR